MIKPKQIKKLAYYFVAPDICYNVPMHLNYQEPAISHNKNRLQVMRFSVYK